MTELFIVDRMLGRLARWLRILGYDTLYWRGNDWQALVEKGRGRIFLTRTMRLPHRGNFRRITLVREDNPDLQLRNVIRELGLKIDEHRLFSRCIICNRQLGKIPKEDVEGRVPAFIFSTYSEFHSCPGCSRIYWKGTHQENMRKKVLELLSH
ncbi:MAG: hypothetical protein GTO13_06690 [Proteobacteria bacterium]|nr:hypothetical protein [Pseudomonadota bacterium]